MRRVTMLASAAVLCGGVAFAMGVPADAPFVDVDPVVDGADSFVGEWTDGLAAPDGFTDPITLASPAGTFYYENRDDWKATSSSAATATYPGPTFFVAHDIWGAPTGGFAGFRSNDAGDWNYVKVTYASGRVVECWNFGGHTTTPAPPHADVNELDDGLWLADAVGLMSSSLIPEGTASDFIDDRGFIVRRDEDPSTDRHWFPGDPEPGDAGWDWDDFYGCFARSGFNKTFQDNLTDPDPAHAANHECYEWCFHESVWNPPPLQCTQIRIEWVDPPKRALVFVAPDWWVHFGDPPIPTMPSPALIALGVSLALGGAWTFRRRRGPGVSLLAVALAGVLAGCGGSGGNDDKDPVPIRPLPRALKNCIPTQPYQDQILVQGDSPPFAFTLAPGSTLPPGLNLLGDGTVQGQTPGGTQGATSFFDVFVDDALARRVTVSTAIRVEPDPYVPLELVSMSLTGSLTIVGKVGQPLRGVCRVRGGDPLATYTFSSVDCPGGVSVQPNGIVRGTPGAATMGPTLSHVRIQNGTLDSFFDVFFDIQP